jgi:hypothetical protein
MAQRVSSGKCKGQLAGRKRFARAEATMRFLDSTSLVMLLIMAGVFGPITVIHVLATSVFQ